MSRGIRWARLVGLVGLVAGTPTAAAQQHWDDVREGAVATPPPSRWTLEVKLGPYRPAIDEAFALPEGAQGPFAFVYGDDAMLLPVVALDRYFLYPAGQLGVTASLGYTYRTASGFDLDADGNLQLDDEGNPLRYEGYRTVFRLYPMTAGAVYRFTWLDERLGVPLVPYAKAGVAYYAWRFLRPEDTVERVAEDPLCTPTRCLANRSRGATWGWVATAGIALRTDRIDPVPGERLAREFGIEHTGLFFEVSEAVIDGLGGTAKLRLSDRIWSAGISFDF
jgi:hypothetical protein